MKCPHRGGDDPLIDDNTPTEILLGFFLIADLQIIHTLLPVFLLGLLPLFEGVPLFAHMPAIEDADGLDLIVEEQVDHLEDEVKEVVGIDVLVEFEGAAVASFVEPGHHVDCHGLILEGADVFFYDYWFEELQKALDSHWRVYSLLKSHKIKELI